MWRTIAGSIAFAGLMTSCLPASPSSDRLAASIVLTKHAPGVNFGTYQTFYIRPEIRELKDEGEIEPLPDSVAGPLLDETRDQLKKRGFEEAASKEEADLAVDMVYINTQWVATSCYSWWDGYYWGYPGYPYYPYYPWGWGWYYPWRPYPVYAPYHYWGAPPVYRSPAYLGPRVLARPRAR